MPDDSQNALDALYHISRLVSDTEDAHEALRLILDEIMRALPATSASIALVNPDTRRLQIEVARGLPDDSSALELPLGRGVTGWVALHGKPLVIANVHEDVRYFKLKETIKSEMAVPMLLDGLVVGVVNVDSEQPAAFGDRELKILTLLTNEATKVVGRLWLINQLRSKARQLESLIATGQTLVSKLELEAVLETAANQALALMPCRLCAIFLLNPEGDALRLATLAGLDAGPTSHTENLALADSVLGSVIRHKKQVEVQNVAHTEEHHFSRLVASAGLVSLLVTPILAGDRAIGALNVYTDRSHRFNNDERRIFATLANLCAVAVQNAELYTRVFASEESLRKNERLTTLGLLAAEIAHEIRNPLTVITLLLDTMDLQFPEEDVRAHDLAIIREKLGHLGELVERVLGFSKSGTALQSRWSLSAIIEDTVRLLRLKIEQSRVAVRFHPPARKLLVDAHKAQLQQVVLNLLLNSIQAMPHGGRIDVELRDETRDGAHVAVVTVRDTGPGVPPAIAGRVFESFLTARKDGTGLGLAICKRILRDHRGDIELVETPPGEGATFRFWLPSASGV
ncbi:MAG TPA: GAF domain-containing protein [Opitutales bacterium]|nr:GAF domain-containing protein [Opitutales bacterium]